MQERHLDEVTVTGLEVSPVMHCLALHLTCTSWGLPKNLLMFTDCYEYGLLE